MYALSPCLGPVESKFNSIQSSGHTVSYKYVCQVYLKKEMDNLTTIYPFPKTKAEILNCIHLDNQFLHETVYQQTYSKGIKMIPTRREVANITCSKYAYKSTFIESVYKLQCIHSFLKLPAGLCNAVKFAFTKYLESEVPGISEVFLPFPKTHF